MPSKNKKQLNFFLLVKAYKESGENGVFRQLKHLEGYKPRLTPTYMNKLIKTAESIADSDLIDMTSGVEGENPLGDTRNLKVGYWALFTGKYKPAGSKDEIPKEGEFIAQIKKVDNAKGLVEFNQKGFRNKYGNTIFIPRRAVVINQEFQYLDYALFDNVIRTGKNPQELAKPKENMEESIELKSKSHKGNRLFDMLKTAKFQHYDSPKGELSTLNHGEEDRKRIVSKLGKADKKTYREWIKTPEGKESLERFEDFTSPLFKKNKIEESVRKMVRKLLRENLSGENLIPDDIIDSFYNRIKKILDAGADKKHPSVERELNRIKMLNADVIPEKIKALLTEEIENNNIDLSNYNGWEKQSEWFGNPSLGLESYKKIFQNPFNNKMVPVFIYGKEGEGKDKPILGGTDEKGNRVLSGEKFDASDWHFVVHAGANSQDSYSGGFYPETPTLKQAMDIVDEKYKNKKLIH